MSTYRRKSTNVELRVLTEADRDEVVAWVQEHGTLTLDEPGGALVLLLADGTSRVELGDAIVRDEVLGFARCPADAVDARFYAA